MSMTIENIGNIKVVKPLFSEEHLKEIERLFLGPSRPIGLDIINEDVAEILNTFNYAYFEGDASICHIYYGMKDPVVLAVEALCQKLNVFYEIYENGDEITLNLRPM